MDIQQAVDSPIFEIAQLLKSRKENKKSTVLFLGARSGGLFRSQRFYEICQAFSSSTLSDLEPIKRFRECYNALKRRDFGQTDLDAFLRDPLEKVQFSRTDICVVELIKEGLFDIIITTNPDDLLEYAFNHIEMREPRDFQVLVPRHGAIGEDTINVIINKPYKVVKAFGDLASNEYRVIGQEFYLNRDTNLKKMLESTLKRDILMIGFDPIWDEEVDDIFPFSPEGGAFWYVNDVVAEEHLHVSRALKQRKGSRSIIGSRGSYENFIEELHNCIMGRGPLSYELVNKMFHELELIRQLSEQLRKDVASLHTDVQKLLIASRENL